MVSRQAILISHALRSRPLRGASGIMKHLSFQQSNVIES